MHVTSAFNHYNHILDQVTLFPCASLRCKCMSTSSDTDGNVYDNLLKGTGS